MAAESDHASPEGSRRTGRWWTRERTILAGMVVAFAALSFYAGVVSYMNLQSDNATDLGIFMQAVSSTVRGGHPAPFFETYDCLSKFRCSFLLVHPSPLLYGVVPIYAILPSAYTLFAIQSVGVALAALPLYGLTRRATGSGTKGLVAAGLYLAWAPTLGGEAFSFHMESFLPVTLLSVAYFWQVRRYRLGLLAALAAFLTIEVAPIFTFLIGVFFLIPYAVSAFRLWRARRKDPGPSGFRSSVRYWGGRLRSTLGRVEVRYTLLLLGISVVAYAILYLFMNVFGARLLGVSPPPIPPGLGGVFFNNSTPGISPLTTTLASPQLVLTLEFWLILFALAGFIPLLAPRSLVVSIPWVGWTFLTNSNRFTTIGHQYTLVAAGPIFFGVAYGLRRIPIGRGGPAPADSTAPTFVSRPARPRRARRNSVIAAGFVIALVGANVLFLPIDPALSSLGVNLGAPFEPGYQMHTLLLRPGFSDVEELLSEIPHNASVTAPYQVFPLIANLPYAVVLISGADKEDFSTLPENISNNPSYVVLYPSFYPLWRGPFKGNVSDPSMYDVRAYVTSTTVGPLFLYERGYTGPPTLIGSPFPPYSATLLPEHGLTAGGIGEVRANASSPSGEVITTRPQAPAIGELWHGPDTTLPAGSYDVTAMVSATFVEPNATHRSTLLRIESSGPSFQSENATFPPSDFGNGTWTNVSFEVSTAVPILDFTISGFLEIASVEFAVAEVTLTPVTAP